jgi:hypothetical protein
MLIGEIEIEVARVLGDADVNGALRPLKLRPRFAEIER